MTTIPTNYSSTAAAGASSRRDEHSPTMWGRVSWGPIMMGAVCAIGLQLIFTVLGIALGTTAGDVGAGASGTSASTVGLTAGLWWLVTGTIALAVGGFVFGRLSGLTRSVPLTLEAATLWSVVALFGFFVVWSGTGMLSQAASPIGALASSSPDRQTSSVAYVADSEPRTTANPGAARSDDRSGIADTHAAEEALRATRTASWWSVIGLVVGVGVTIAAAWTAALPATRDGMRSTESARTGDASRHQTR